MVEQSPQPSVTEIGSASQSTQDQSSYGIGSQPLRQAPLRPDRQRGRRASPLYLPLWSLGFTLLAVIILASGAILALLSLRAENTLPQVDPVIQIVVADPAKLSESSGSGNADARQDVSSAGIEVVIAAQADTDLAMAGPLLPTVAFEPTAVPINVGASVVVSGVGDQELNIRNLAGITQSQILFRAPEGSLFDIIGGPQEADGFSWWKVRDKQFQVEGWAVANYLQVNSK